MRFRKLVNAYLDELAADWSRCAAELRTGVTLIEAVAVDEFNTELRMVTPSDAERSELRRATILLAQAGIRLEDVEPMLRFYLEPWRDTRGTP